MTRKEEDEAYAAECKRVLDDRAMLVVRRYLADAEEAELVYREALSLRSDAEGKHAAALAASDTLRGLIYRKTGFRGRRPASLKILDNVERRAREQCERCSLVAEEAQVVMAHFEKMRSSAAAAKNPTTENGAS